MTKLTKFLSRPDDAGDIKPIAGASRSGTETRRRNKRLLVRLDGRELTEIVAGAEAAGLTLASFARKKILSGPARKPSRRAPADAALLAKVLGELNRVGSNLNQIARAINNGDHEAAKELPAAVAVFRGTVVLIMRALGFNTDADHH